ncbi:MAG: glutamyl-tRNA reductase [Myxococcales bacterium]|nr:glutamyl-tRNA reductase [Myxococcales bacterium]
MSDVVVVGLSHHTAPLELRERLAVPRDRLPPVLHELAPRVFAETVLVSTCNRVELYGVADDPNAAARAAIDHLRGRAESAEELESSLYVLRGAEAVRHAFRVAASLDSMVVGEPQILGQFKEAFEAASETGTVGTLLGRCFTRAFAVAKRVRSETGIAEGTVSVSSIATSLAKKIFGELGGRRVLLLGAGEMGEAAGRSLAGSGAHLTVVNRSPTKATTLARELGGVAAGYEQLASELVGADVVICSTSSQTFVLTHELMKGVVKARRHRPLFVIDIAVPRDVDPRVGELENVFLYDVDDLQKVAQENLEARRKSADAAERIVDIEVGEFEVWRRSLELTPTIVALRRRVEEVLAAELERTLPRLGGLDEKDRRALDKMVSAMASKLLHSPLVALKRSGGEPDGAALISATRALFALDEPAKAEPEEKVAPATVKTPVPEKAG